MKQAAKATALVLAVSLLSGCSNPEADTKAAVDKQKAIVCETLAKDLSNDKVLMSNNALKGFNELAKIDPTYTELAQQAYELNMIAQLSKAGVKSQDTLPRVLNLYAIVRQFCDN